MKRQTSSTILTAGFLAVATIFMASTEVQGAILMSHYEAYPPFLGGTAETYEPNILLLVDNSDSLNQKAYSGAFDPDTTYAGLFNPMRCYRYSSEIFEYDSSDKAGISSTCTSGSYRYDGNFMNWATMRRLDVVKWVLVGGNCSTSRESTAPNYNCDGSGGSYLEGQGQQDSMFGDNLDWTQSVSAATAANRIDPPSGPSDPYYVHVVGSDSSLWGQFCLSGDSDAPTQSSDCESSDEYHREIRVQPPAPAEDRGVVQEIFDQARFGLMQFNDPDINSVTDGGHVTDHVDWKLTGGLSQLIANVERTEAIAESQPAEALYEAARYFAQISPEYDVNDFKTGDQNFDPYWWTTDWISPAQYVACCRSFVILLTDGEPTADTNIPTVLKDYHSTSHGYLDDVALWARTTDLRQATIPVINESGHAIAEDQDVTLYTVFAFGTGSAALKEASKAGGFEDANDSDTPDIQSEWDSKVNSTGAGGSDGVPDTYFEAPEGSQLKEQILAAITSILQQSGSGSSASVQASSKTGDGAVYQTFFYPTVDESGREVTWVGYAQGLFLDTFGHLREDTDGDAHLVYSKDKIIESTFDGTTGVVTVDRFDDNDGNGLKDSSTPSSSVELRQTKALWEAGEVLANTAQCNRNILTWIDVNGDGEVDSGEEIEFNADTCTGGSHVDNTSKLSPFLRPGGAPFTADNIIDFIRGEQVAGMRDRELTVSGSLKVWKLGDSVYAPPVVVGAPQLRYDLRYGDTSYTEFFQEYDDRRNVAYVGANDGMLHAFNAGWFFPGDDPGTSDEDHGYFCTKADCSSGGKALGEELWGFIPQELLPHLRWLTDPSYTHVYYVDLQPKVTDARIFCDSGGDAPTPCITGQGGSVKHPNGWGTILLGGFRLGGSCGACTTGDGAPPMTFSADFDGGGSESRTFYSAYFVLDVTDPDEDPKLLWSFSSSDLGLTTNVPSMLRVNPTSSGTTDHANAKWYMVVGSGPNGYDGEVKQAGKMFAIDLAVGPESGNNKDNNLVTTMVAEDDKSSMASTVAVDPDLDYRVEMTYLGSSIKNLSTEDWHGKLFRLNMNECSGTSCSPSDWGIPDGSDRQPTEILDTFSDGSSTVKLGPVTSSASVTLDDAGKAWVFAGSGRYWHGDDGDDTTQQYVVGVKDSVANGGCTESTQTNCHDNDFANVSGATICVLGTTGCASDGSDQVSGVGADQSFASLIGLVASKDGWVTTLPDSGERLLARPLVFGGFVIFPTFVPPAGGSSTCNRSDIGTSYVYALNYMTGTANSSEVLGTSGDGKTNLRRDGAGMGQASEAVVHVGHDNKSGKATAFIKKSTGEMTGISMTTGGALASRRLSWAYRQI